MANFSQLLELIANQFRKLGIPESVVHWGHLVMRTVHAYMGSAALCLLFLHAVFGLKLGLAI